MLKKTKKNKLNIGIDKLFKKVRYFQKFIKKIPQANELVDINKENFSYNEHDINKYINKIFEQQEKERIVRWIVNSIRETLDLDIVLKKITGEIGRLLKVDRCIFAQYQPETGKFKFHNEYKTDETMICPDTILDLPKNWCDFLLKNQSSLIVNNYELELKQTEQNYFKTNDIKSLIIIPIIDRNEIYGIVMVQQVSTLRKWKEAHIEILKDLAGQISIAIRQAVIHSQLQKTTKLKNDFFIGMSHELRTPLNAIIGFSDMLLMEDFGKLNEKQQKFVSNISISGNHLLELVNGLLDLSKIESKCFELNYEDFNVLFAIHETVDILRGMAITKTITIKTELKEGIVNADILRFKQIMYNLLSNAIKFTPENGTIIINSEFYDNNFKVEIIDDGIGISKEDQKKIFLEFHQVNTGEKGTGLGLSLAKKLVEAHKGTINVESETGKGSKFAIIFPTHSYSGCFFPLVENPIPQ